MTKFEQIGVGYQYGAQSKEDANRSFAYPLQVLLPAWHAH